MTRASNTPPALSTPHCDYDVMILGGGPAGLACGIHLQQQGRNVLVVERTAPWETRIGEHLPPLGCGMLHELGVDEEVWRGPQLECRGVQAFWLGEERHEDYLFSPWSKTGLNLCRSSFDGALARRFQELGGEVAWGFSWTGQSTDRGGWSVRLRPHGGIPAVCRTRYIVDASGFRSRLGQQQNARRVVHDRLTAVCRFGVTSGKVADASVLIETIDDGWWYSTQLPDQRVIACWFTDAETIMNPRRTPVDWFRYALCRAPQMRSRLKHVKWSEPVVRRVESSRLQPVCGTNWLAVGDAAMCFDPISSLGLTKALAGARIAARQVGDGLAPAEYEQAMHLDFDNYCRQRDAWYAEAVGRDGFWRRRQMAALNVLADA